MTDVNNTQEVLLAAIGVMYAEVRTTTWVSPQERALAGELEDLLQTLMRSPSVVERLAAKIDGAGRIECVRTGCQVHLTATNEWAYGDLFRVGTTLVLKAAVMTRDPVHERTHVVCDDWQDWAGQDRRHIVMQPGSWRWLGYDGQVL